MIGQILAGVVAPVSDVAKQYLANKNEETKAKTGYKVAVFQAKAELAKEELQQSFSLDRLSLKQMAKTWWDEAICLIPLGILGYAIFYALFKGVYPELVPPQEIYSALKAMPVELQILIGVIYMRYLGLQGFALKMMAMYREMKMGSKPVTTVTPRSDAS